jgi:invasion protein IalB
MRGIKQAGIFAFAAAVALAVAPQAEAQQQQQRAPTATQRQVPTPLPRPADAGPAQSTPVQVASVAPAAATAAAAQPPAWTSHCASAARGSAPDCSIAQTAYLSQTGQMIASVSIRLPASTKQPVMMVHVPVGLYLPAGVGVQVDEGKVETLVIQTCDLKGCYAATTVAPELMAEMTRGKRFSVIVQNLSRQNVTVPLTLTQFAETYKQIQ